MSISSGDSSVNSGVQTGNAINLQLDASQLDAPQIQPQLDENKINAVDKAAQISLEKRDETPQPLGDHKMSKWESIKAAVSEGWTTLSEGWENLDPDTKRMIKVTLTVIAVATLVIGFIALVAATHGVGAAVGLFILMSLIMLTIGYGTTAIMDSGDKKDDNNPELNIKKNLDQSDTSIELKSNSLNSPEIELTNNDLSSNVEIEEIDESDTDSLKESNVSKLKRLQKEYEENQEKLTELKNNQQMNFEKIKNCEMEIEKKSELLKTISNNNKTDNPGNKTNNTEEITQKESSTIHSDIEARKTLLYKLNINAKEIEQSYVILMEKEAKLLDLINTTTAMVRRQIDEPAPLISDTPVGREITPVGKIANTPIDDKGNKLVCFYKTGPTKFLGNFAPCKVDLWGHHFKCSEAAFQWKKYQLAGIDDQRMNEFFQADGEKAFQLNRVFENDYQNIFATGWINGVRDKVMWEVLQAKFSQNQALKSLLDETKGAYLLEHNPASRDSYWSDNNDGSGKNMLGKMLMALRDGDSRPPMDDTSDADKVNYLATYANKGLGYAIF